MSNLTDIWGMQMKRLFTYQIVTKMPRKERTPSTGGCGWDECMKAQHLVLREWLLCYSCSPEEMATLLLLLACLLCTLHFIVS